MKDFEFTFAGKVEAHRFLDWLHDFADARFSFSDVRGNRRDIVYALCSGKVAANFLADCSDSDAAAIVNASKGTFATTGWENFSDDEWHWPTYATRPGYAPANPTRRRGDINVPNLLADVQRYAERTGLTVHSALAIVRAQLGLEVI